MRLGVWGTKGSVAELRQTQINKKHADLSRLMSRGAPSTDAESAVCELCLQPGIEGTMMRGCRHVLSFTISFIRASVSCGAVAPQKFRKNPRNHRRVTAERHPKAPVLANS